MEIMNIETRKANFYRGPMNRFTKVTYKIKPRKGQIILVKY